MNLLILGCGGYGMACKDLCDELGIFEKIDFLDDNATQAIGKLNEYEKYVSSYENAFIAFGNPQLRNQWQVRVETVGYKVPVLIHPKAIVSKTVKIESGTVIMPGAIVQSNVRIGRGGIVSAGAIIDHDSIIGEYCHVNAGAIISSMSKVEGFTKVDYGKIY